MKKSLDTPTSVSTASPALSRRTLFAGAGTVGALAAAAVVLPKVAAPVASVAATSAKPASEGGYQLTEHVQRYYQTARV